MLFVNGVPVYMLLMYSILFVFLLAAFIVYMLMFWIFLSQNNIISAAKPVTVQAILDTFNHALPESVGIADLGCSSGPNALFAVSEILKMIFDKWKQLGRPGSPEFRVHLNDLTGNDFNTVFSSLPAFYNRLMEEKGPEFGPCFVSGMPGSFYGRLFPSNSLHFVHSSSSLHWLSQVGPVVVPSFYFAYIYILRSYGIKERTNL